MQFPSDFFINRILEIRPPNFSSTVYQNQDKIDNMIELKRFFYYELSRRLLGEALPFLQVLLGPRQVGKSTAIAQIAGAWPGSKIIESADQVTPPTTEWIEFLWQRALEQPGICLLALDEIQKVPNWSAAVKILFDRDRKKNKLRVVLSGSASLSIQRGLSESLAGRYELIRCPHWAYDETRQAFGWDLPAYLKFGGYPAPANLINEPGRWQAFIRDGIIEPVLGRDLQSIVTIQKPALLRQLFALAMLYPAQEISYQKLLGQLQDQGNTATIKHYLEILSGGFLIATLEKYSGSLIRQKGSSPKLLPMAPALIHAFTDPKMIDSNADWRGRVFEAAIGAHLYHTECDLFYWRAGDLEVDFVLTAGKEVYGIEVKSGRRKRPQGIIAFKKKFPKAKTIQLDWESGGAFLDGPAKLERLI